MDKVWDEQQRSLLAGWLAGLLACWLGGLLAGWLSVCGLGNSVWDGWVAGWLAGCPQGVG